MDLLSLTMTYVLDSLKSAVSGWRQKLERAIGRKLAKLQYYLALRCNKRNRLGT